MFTLASDAEFIIPIVVIATGGTIWIISIFAGVLKDRAKEKTRREIAAYVAEGSIAPQDGIAMLEAGREAEDAEQA